MELLVWWLCFYGSDQKVCGACLVRAPDLPGAFMAAGELRLLPDIGNGIGMCQGLALPEKQFALIPFAMESFMNRFLSPEEARALSDRLNEEIFS